MAKKKGDRPEYLTPEELDRIENVVVGDLFFSTLYRVLRYSGRRIGELVGTERKNKITGGIMLRDIDLEKKQMKTIILKTKKRRLQIECPVCKKNNSYKNKFCRECGKPLPEIDERRLKYEEPESITIPMRPELPTIIQIYIEKHKPGFRDNDYIFREYSISYLKKAIKRHCRQASINKRFSLHGFRHCFITNCKKMGMSNEEISLWTGHKKPISLDVYNRMVPDDVLDKMMKVKL